jgi:hypothetical protein
VKKSFESDVNLPSQSANLFQQFCACLLNFLSKLRFLLETFRRTKRRKIVLIESNDKCRYPKKIDLLRDFAAGVYLSEAPSPPRFVFRVVKQFCRF